MQINCQVWVHKSSFQSDKLKVEGNAIESLKGYANVLSKDILKGKFKFSIQVCTIGNFIAIGVVDSAYISQQYWGGNLIDYFNDGRVNASYKSCPSNKFSFKEKDIVSLYGNLEKGMLELKVNEHSVCINHFNILINEQIEWVAHIGLFKGSCVDVKESFPQINCLTVYLAECMYKWDEDLMSSYFQVIDLANIPEEQQNIVKQ